MRAREFLMKDAYSFHLDRRRPGARVPQHARRLQPHLHPPGPEVPRGAGRHRRDRRRRLAGIPRAGRFGRGRDRVLRAARDYAANVETAEAAGAGARARPPAKRCARSTRPTQKTCEDVAALLGIALQRTVKSVALMGVDATAAGFVLALVRGDHVVNEIKLAKLPGLADYRLATEAEIAEHLGSEPGFLGPVGAERKPITRRRRPQRRRDGRLRRRRQRNGLPPRRRQLGPRPARAATLVADIRNVVEGDRVARRPAARSASRAASRSAMCSSSAASTPRRWSARCSTRTARPRSRRWAATASACRASSPRRSSRTTTTPASSGRRRWRRGRWRCA